MLVGVNTVSSHPDRGGNGPGSHVDRYLRRTLQAIRALQEDTSFVIFTDEHNHDIYNGWERIPLEQSGGALSFIRSGSPVEAAAKKAKCDMLFSPLEDTPAGLSIPYVLYALDIFDYENDPGQTVPKRPATLKTVKKVCAGARSVVVPSEYLRRRCLDIFEIPLNKVVVAMPGVDETFRNPFGSMVARPYFVTFCDGLVARSIDKLQEAFAQLEKEIPHTFVVAGPGCAEEPEDWGDRFVRIEHMPDNHLAGLYQNGDFWFYPCLHDGAGVRVLEALRSGTPVITARTGALHEICGDGPLYYNPGSAASMLQVIRRVLNDDEVKRADRVHIGQNATIGYEWERTAWKVLTAFRKS